MNENFTISTKLMVSGKTRDYIWNGDYDFNVGDLILITDENRNRLATVVALNTGSTRAKKTLNCRKVLLSDIIE